MIPVSVIVATRNEALRLGRCLEALRDFDEIIVVDSSSTDETSAIARTRSAAIVNFVWNGRYPKKRQWCLDHLSLKHDWVFFVDADEVLTRELATEIAALFATGPLCAGYFVKGSYMAGGKPLRFGLKNNKLCLFDRRRFAFPVVDDLDLSGMGEMEGHYQPVPKSRRDNTGTLRHALHHYADEDRTGWEERHRRYAAWERGMNARNGWPDDPVPWRQAAKRLFRAAPGRPVIAFLHSFVLKGGFLDGAAGFRLAADRFIYYKKIY